LRLVEYLESQKSLIDSEIAKVIPKSSPIRHLYDVQWEFIAEGGKRWRPILCMLVHKALGGDIERVLPFAAAVELVHNFSLIHDDIEDGDRTRRGRPTLWVLYGIPKSINIGDSLLNKAYESVTRLEEKGFSPKEVLWALRLLCESTISLSEGQAMDMNFLDRREVTEEEYMEMVWRKTGVLVSAATTGGAYLAGAGDSVLRDMMDYGKLIGPAFQITDDVLNVSGEYRKYKKEIGGDIGEGKRTLMVIHLLRNASEEEAERVRRILSTPREKTSKEDSSFVLGLMERYGSIEYARGIAERMFLGAKQKLLSLPPSSERDLLKELTEFLVRREF